MKNNKNDKNSKKPNPDIVETPPAESYFGQPKSPEEMINSYGTYEIQRTADTDNYYPMIAQGNPGFSERHGSVDYGYRVDPKKAGTEKEKGPN